MEIGVSFNICFLIISLLVATVYFIKPRINSFENSIYKLLLIDSIFGCAIGIPTYYLTLNCENYTFLTFLIPKIYLMFIITWCILLTSYVILLIIKNDNAKKYYKLLNRIVLTLLFINYIIILFLPIEYYSSNNIVYTYGTAVNYTFGLSFVFVASWFIMILFRFKTIRKRKCIPIIAVVVIGTVVSIIQRIDPSIRLMTPAIAFITLIMYFTIENPDVKMIEQLNIARDQAEKANKAKTDFLSSMSHEIRTPLNAIDGFCQLMLDEKDMKVIKDEARDIMMASQNLLEIVNGILDISKIEANKLEIVKTDYEPEKIFDELIKLTKARLGEKPLEFKTNIAKDLPDFLNGDYVRLKQIVLNLLTNAVKYTKKGEIEFSVRIVKKDNVCRLIITVRDTGIGIKKENIDKLFDKFERMDLENNITIEGTGLGLAITKKLVELMKGSIIVDSEYGKGSTFTVVLDQRIVHKSKVVEPEVKKTTKMNFKNKKVLVVDDNNINLKVANKMLEGYKLNIDLATSGFECIDKIQKGNEYDLIFMDDMMPKMSGVETFEKLKKAEDFNTPVVALTANAIEGMKEKYLNAGFCDYISKPIDKNELERVLKKYLNK